MYALPQHQVPPHFIMIVPGYMGSTPRDGRTTEITWMDFTRISPNPLPWDEWLYGLLDGLAYPNEDLVPADNEDREPDVHCLSCDWRHDSRVCLQQFGEAIEQ